MMKKIKKERTTLTSIKGLFVGLIKKNDGFGIAELLWIAGVIGVIAFVSIPGLRAFATTVTTALNTWWTNTTQIKVFPLT